jgi:hypothetical protein
LFCPPCAILSPLSIVVKDGTPRGIFVRQQPPLSAGAQQIEGRIDDAPERIGLPPPGRMAPLQQRRQHGPFLITQVAGVETNVYGRGSSSVKQPASAAAAQHQTYSESDSWSEQ